MHRLIGFVPLAALTVAAAAAAAVALVQDDPFGSPAASGELWERDRGSVAPVAAEDQPRLDCAGAEAIEGTILDFIDSVTADDLDPVERAQSMAEADAEPSIALDSATWVDVGPTRGVVTFTDDDGRVRDLVRFELVKMGWRAVARDRCVG